MPAATEAMPTAERQRRTTAEAATPTLHTHLRRTADRAPAIAAVAAATAAVADTAAADTVTAVNYAVGKYQKASLARAGLFCLCPQNSLLSVRKKLLSFLTGRKPGEEPAFL